MSTKPLDRADWDFSELSKDWYDRQLCLEYEYSRESPAAIEKVLQLRAQPFEMRDGHRFSYWPNEAPQKPYQREIEGVSILFVEGDFPTCPYLKLPNELRARARENLVRRDMGPLEAQPLTRELLSSMHANLESPTERREADEEPETEVLLTVRWRHNNDQIISVFREWLLRSRPSQHPNWKDKGGREERVQDKLNYPAAYRFEKSGLRRQAAKMGFASTRMSRPGETRWRKQKDGFENRREPQILCELRRAI